MAIRASNKPALTSFGLSARTAFAAISDSRYFSSAKSLVAFSKLACIGERSAACDRAASPASCRPRFLSAPPSLKNAPAFFGFNLIASCKKGRASSHLFKFSSTVPRSSCALGYSGAIWTTVRRIFSLPSKSFLRSKIEPRTDKKFTSRGSSSNCSLQSDSALSRSPLFRSVITRSNVRFCSCPDKTLTTLNDHFLTPTVSVDILPQIKDAVVS